MSVDRRAALVALVTALTTGCIGGGGGGSAGERRSRTGTSTRTRTRTRTGTPTATRTATPTPSEPSREAYREFVLEKYNDVRDRWGLASVERVAVLDEVAQHRVEAVATGDETVPVDVRLRERDATDACGNATAWVGRFTDGGTVEKPGGDGYLEVETPRDVAALAVKTWIQPAAYRDVVLSSAHRRLGVGAVDTGGVVLLGATLCR